MNDLALLPENPVAVLTDAKTYSEFYAKMKAETDAFVPDISTVKGRGEIAALAYKVTRTKTAIDAAGKKLNEEAREKINAVDASRRKIREELDALADAVRKPLTEWENKEAIRKDNRDQTMAWIKEATVIPNGASVQYISVLIDDLVKVTIDPDDFRDELNDAVAAKQSALDALNHALTDARQREADAAELARLRAEAEAREIAERERIERERIAKELAEKEAREKAAYAEHVKRQAEAAEKAQKEAAEREARAIETARAEALAKAQREHAEQMAKIEAENRRLAQAEADRLAAVEKTKREEDARAADRKHRGEIMGAAKTAMMELGATEEIAKKIVLAIVANEIPNTRISF